MDEKALQTIQDRQQKEKQLLIEQLRKTPIVQFACDKTDIGRTTFYKWKKEDPEFASQADMALTDGKSLINDAAESQLISLITHGNLGAVIFWLKNNHSSYANRVEITTKAKTEEGILSPQQQELLKKALSLANLLPEQQEQTPAPEQEIPVKKVEVLQVSIQPSKEDNNATG